MKRALAYGGFCLLDHGFWLLIQLLPGPRLMGLAQQRPWQRLKRSLPPLTQPEWQARISWLLRTRCRRASCGSTCLSRSLSGRLLLDLIDVANELHLGMNKLNDGRKEPHAWLVEPNSGCLFTSGLPCNSGVPLTQL